MEEGWTPVKKGRIVATTVIACTAVGWMVMKLSSPNKTQTEHLRKDIIEDNRDRYVTIRTANQAAIASILGDRAQMSNTPKPPEKKS